MSRLTYYMTIRIMWTTKKKVSNRRRMLRRVVGGRYVGRVRHKILKLQLVRLIKAISLGVKLADIESFSFFQVFWIWIIDNFQNHITEV